MLLGDSAGFGLGPVRLGRVCAFIPRALPSLWLLLDPLEVSQSGLIEALLPTWSWCWALEGGKAFPGASDDVPSAHQP